MKSDHRGLYFWLMIMVVKADQRIDPAERKLVLEAAKRFGLRKKEVSAIERMLDDQDNDLANHFFLPPVINGSMLLYLLRDAYAFAASDGEVTDQERSVIKAFLTRYGVRPRQITSLIKWASQEHAHLLKGLALFE